ncbi:MAG: succinate dehydrogenase, hydrophobic membrane anchor protein [Burkholderiales bacterium]
MRLLTGLSAWTAQRASAVFMLGFLLWLAGALLVSPPDGYEQWRAIVARPAASAGFSVFFAAVLVHAWVGVRDVVLDYVHHPRARAAVLAVVAAALFTIGVWLGLALAALHVG